MKKRMQLTIGPATQKALTKVARQNNKLTGLNHTSVDVLQAACGLGLNSILEKTLPGEKGVSSIRD